MKTALLEFILCITTENNIFSSIIVNKKPDDKVKKRQRGVVRQRKHIFYSYSSCLERSGRNSRYPETSQRVHRLKDESKASDRLGHDEHLANDMQLSMRYSKEFHDLILESRMVDLYFCVI